MTHTKKKKNPQKETKTTYVPMFSVHWRDATPLQGGRGGGGGGGGAGEEGEGGREWEGGGGGLRCLIFFGRTVGGGS